MLGLIFVQSYRLSRNFRRHAVAHKGSSDRTRPVNVSSIPAHRRDISARRAASSRPPHLEKIVTDSESGCERDTPVADNNSRTVCVPLYSSMPTRLVPIRCGGRRNRLLADWFGKFRSSSISYRMITVILQCVRLSRGYPMRTKHSTRNSLHRSTI